MTPVRNRRLTGLSPLKWRTLNTGSENYEELKGMTINPQAGCSVGHHCWAGTVYGVVALMAYMSLTYAVPFRLF